MATVAAVGVAQLPDGTRIAGELCVERGAACTRLRWTRFAGTGPARLEIRPLLAGRDFHGLHRENPALRFDPEIDQDLDAVRVTWRPYPGVAAICAVANAGYTHAPILVHRNFLYTAERDRGLDAEERSRDAGRVFDFDLAAAPAALVLAATAAPAGIRASSSTLALPARRRGARRSPPTSSGAGDQYTS